MSLPPVEVPQGAIRFNTDSQKLEFYAQDQWWEMVIDTPALGVAADTGAGARGIIAGAYTTASPLNEAHTDYINISSTGDVIDFGNLTAGRGNFAAFSSSTRGVFAGGYTSGGLLSSIESITISSTGSAVSSGFSIFYGNGTATTVKNVAGLSNSTRGLIAGGTTTTTPGTPINNIDYVTISSLGNGVDFGDLTVARRFSKGLASPTRGVFGAGQTPTTYENTMDFVTIASLGNAVDFGDLTVGGYGGSTCANATRGIHAGRWAPGNINTIDYITISTLGNAINFGDLINASHGGSGMSSPTRGVFGGAYISPTLNNAIEYIQIATQGNAVDFGDQSLAKYYADGCSNAHGGL
jgi:hypothetical protein